MDECVFCGSTEIREVKGAFLVVCCDNCGAHSCLDDDDELPRKQQKTRLRNNPFSEE